MSLLSTVARGIRASVTLDNINLSTDSDFSLTGRGPGSISLVGVDKSATYEKLYRSQVWVRTVVDKLSRGVGRLPLKAYASAEAPNERERVREGPLADLLARPYAGGNPSLWKGAIVGNMAIHGNAIVVKVRPRPGRPPAELIPSSFAFWRPALDDKGRLAYWVFSDARQRIPFLPEEVIHFRWWGPGQGIVSPSPLEALASTIKIEDAARRMQISSYEHGNRPVGAFTTPQVLKLETAARLRADLDERYGGVDNAFRIAIMDAGSKWEPMAHTLVDAELINTLRFTREEVSAVYDIPPPVIHILDRATFSNITEQHRMMYQDTLGPWATLIEETVQTELIDQEPTMAGWYVEFDFREVLRGDPLQEMEAGVKAVGGPWLSVNEFRATQNLPPIDGGDELNPSPTTPGRPAASSSPLDVEALLSRLDERQAARQTRRLETTRVERDKHGAALAVHKEITEEPL